MQILQHVRLQQHRFLTLRIALFYRERALLGQFVKTRVETFARLSDKRPAESLEPQFDISAIANPLLELGNFSVGRTIARVRS